ncbi:MAG: WXG100 family type VII secretion target [Microbacteriaceae bacterium]|jgi:early secretory antigenic target protein ESAT-6
MTRYNVDSEAVLAAATQARASIGRINAEVHTLNAHLQSLSSSWSGPAATAFLAVHDNWRQTQMRVEESLASLGTSLTHAGTHYQDLEIANARLFHR